jgi:hypothetical protein
MYTEDERTSWAFPLACWTTDHDSVDIYALAGLGGIGFHEEQFRDLYLFPIVDVETDDAGSSWRLWPLVATSDHPERPDPLYYLSLCSRHEFDGEGSWWITPFIGSAYTGSYRAGWAIPFMWWLSEENETQIHMLGGLGGIRYEDEEFRNFYLFPSLAASRDEDGSSWRAWPLVADSTQRKRPDPLYYLSLMSRHEFGDDGNWWVTPFVGSVYSGHRQTSWVAPFAWWNVDDDSTAIRFLGGLGGLKFEGGEFRRFDLFPSVVAETDQEGTSWRVWPLASYSTHPERPDPLYNFSLMSRHEFGDEGNWWVTPLVGSVYSSNERVAWVYPFAWWEMDDDSTDVRFLGGLGGVEFEDGEIDDFDVFPLVSITNDTDPVDPHYIHLFNWHAVEGEGYDFGIFPILGSHKSGTPGVNAKYRFNLLGPLGCYVNDEDSVAGKSSKTHALLVGYGHTHEPAEKAVPGVDSQAARESFSTIVPFYYKESAMLRQWKAGVLSDEEKDLLYGWWKQTVAAPEGTHSDAAVIRLLQSKRVALANADRDSLKKAVLGYAQDNCLEYERSIFRSLVYTHDRGPKQVDWSVLFGVVNHQEDMATGRSCTRVLRYLYSSETEGDETRTSFFPFCKKDSGKTWSDFSFGWRLWHTRKENGKRSGHILFIPWG